MNRNSIDLDGFTIMAPWILLNPPCHSHPRCSLRGSVVLREDRGFQGKTERMENQVQMDSTEPLGNPRLEVIHVDVVTQVLKVHQDNPDSRGKWAARESRDYRENQAAMEGKEVQV